ncbi:MAG TPA: RND transporter [Oceanospirillaceae bacterium]|nr:RND transporter [Oceanospirillaceae bacterium]
MQQIRTQIESAYGRWANWTFDKAWWLLGLMFIIFVALASGMQNVRLDTSTEGFLHVDDPMRIAYNDFKQEFGQDDRILVAVQTDDIFSESNLLKLNELHKTLEQQVPYLAAVDSLISSRVTTGDEESLIVDELFDPWPANAAEYARLKDMAMANPLLANLVIDEQGGFTTLLLQMQAYQVEESSADDALSDLLGSDIGDMGFGNDEPIEQIPLSEAQKAEIIDAVAIVVDLFSSDNFRIYVAGSPQVTDSLQTMLLEDMTFFVALVIFIISSFLTLLFRRASGVLLPLLTVAMGVIATMGSMGHALVPIQTVTQIIPSFLLAVGVGAAIHILAVFYKHYDQHMHADQREGKRQALIYTLEHSGLAITITSLTTAASLVSFATSQVSAISRLGIFASLGVMIMLTFVLVLLPAFIAILPLKRKHKVEASDQAENNHHDWMDQLLKGFSHFSVHHYKGILVATGLLIVAGIAAVSQVGYSHNPLTWLPPENEGRIATEVVDQSLRGSITMEVLIDTHEENGIIQPQTLQALDSLGKHAMTLSGETYFVGKVVSIADVIKEIHKALHANNSAYYLIPDDADLIAQEVLLFENSGSDDLEDLVDSQFSMARMTVKVPWVDAVEYQQLIDELQHKAEQLFGPQVSVSTTGMIPMLAKTATDAIYNTGISYLIAFVAISVMMMAMLGSIRLGLLSMIPNLFPVLAVLALMWILGLPLDLYTILIGAIVIGLAVDDTVHFMHNFKRYFDDHGNVALSIEHTLTGTGRAMLVTSLVLCGGFFAYFFSAMSNLMAFGVLTSFAIVVAVLADFLIAPALMVWLYGTNNSSNTRT